MKYYSTIGLIRYTIFYIDRFLQLNNLHCINCNSLQRKNEIKQLPTSDSCIVVSMKGINLVLRLVHTL